MAISKIVCPDCKKSFKGRDELEGKRIRCPACGSSFVAKASADDEAAAMLMAADSAPMPANATNDDDEEENANPYAVETISVAARCPNCANLMATEDAIICLFCGYNTQSRTLGKTKRVIATTGGDWAGWSGPGIACLLGIVFVVLLQMTYTVALPYWTRNDDMWLWNMLCSEAMYLWITMILVACIWPMGIFVFKRLVVEPKPPESEID
jgi:DNA-directed RNA polymerase subunit RPC12/RpoP